MDEELQVNMPATSHSAVVKLFSHKPTIYFYKLAPPYKSLNELKTYYSTVVSSTILENPTKVTDPVCAENLLSSFPRSRALLKPSTHPWSEQPRDTAQSRRENLDSQGQLPSWSTLLDHAGRYVSLDIYTMTLTTLTKPN